MILLVLVIATALAFDFTNGFHDTANAMATSIATRALSPLICGLAATLGTFVAYRMLRRQREADQRRGAVTAADV